ncbi:MAG: kelch repeat-containing protein [Methylococcales bacterium]
MKKVLFFTMSIWISMANTNVNAGIKVNEGKFAASYATNVAQSGIASQSSISTLAYGYGVPSKAIDGNRNGDYLNGSVTHTLNGDPDPASGLFEWWEVKLNGKYSITQINVFNRTDMVPGRLIPFRLSLFDGTTSVFSEDITAFTSDITGSDVSGMIFNVTSQVGDRVRIQLLHEDYLSLAEVEVYGSPVPIPPPPPATLYNIDRSDFAAGVIGNKVYVFGGYNNGHTNNLISTEMLDLTTNAWTPVADNINNNGTGGGAASGAIMEGKFYVVGSFTGYSAKGIVNSIQEYDPDTNSWTAKAVMPSTHYAATAVNYNDEIYAFGGFNVIKNKSTFYRAVDAYKPLTNTWRKVGQMPQLREAPAVAVMGNKAFVIGGLSLASLKTYRDVSVYNFATRKWKTAGLTPLPTARAFSYGQSAPVLNGKVYLIGGKTLRKATKAEIKATKSKFVEGVSNKVEIYDPVSNTWQIGPSLPQPSKGHVAVVANDTIYLLGGSATTDNVVWTIKDTWKTALAVNETCDLNADSKFSSSDTALFTAACKNGSAYWQCDLNNDGRVNTKDTSNYNQHWKSYKNACPSIK